MNVTIGTRGSKLALVQAEFVKKRLSEAYPQNTYELKIIKTKGDRVQHLALDQIGDKGLFVKEIEQELLDGTIDLAVHSMKDMPSELPEGLCFAKAWEREDPRDVLVLREAASLDELPQHAVIGTGSRRRAFQLQLLRPDLQITGIRGNVDTRLKKIQEQKLDGIVLAAAGLHRLEKEAVITQYLEPEQMIPAATQGTLALELRAGHTELSEQVNALASEEAQVEAETERLFLKEAGGSCHMPVGAWAKRHPDGIIRLLALYGNEDGSFLKKCCVYGKTPQEAVQNAKEELGLSRPVASNGAEVV